MMDIAATQIFRAMDADRSGGVSLTEFKQGQLFAPSGLRAAIREDSAADVFKAFDTDKSNGLSQAELAQGLSLLAPNTASMLLAAQEEQNPISQLLSGLQVGFYSTLPAANSTASNLAYNVLSAYLGFNKIA